MQVTHLLTRERCKMRVARTGKKGMDSAAWRKFDLIVLDVDLPDANSFEMCSDLKQRHISKNTPIVFLADAADKKKVQQCFEFGAAGVLGKPLGVKFVRQLLSHIKHGKDLIEA